jgi:hypothetical protein
MTLVGEEIDGLERSMFSFGRRIGRASHLLSYPFNKTDQDALNIAVMTAPEPVSIMGSEGMDFRPGGRTVSHALGMEKPWRKNIHPRRLRWAAAVVRGPRILAIRRRRRTGPLGGHRALAPVHAGNGQCHRTFLSPILRIFGRSHEPPLRLR